MVFYHFPVMDQTNLSFFLGEGDLDEMVFG